MFNTPEEAIAAIRDTDWRGDALAANAALDKAAQQFPDSAELAAMQSVSLLWRGQRNDALAALGRAQASNSGHPYSLAAAADIAAFEGRFEEAKDLADQVLATGVLDSWLLDRLPSLYAMAHDFPQALALCNRWRELCPNSADAYCSSSTVLQLVGRQEDSERMLDEAEKLFPESPLVWHKRGRALMRSQRLDESIALLQRARDAVSGNFMFCAELATALSFARRGDEAVAAAERSLELNSCSTLAMTAMARVCQQRGKDREAAEWQERAARAIPAMRASAALNQANQAMKRNDARKALAVLDPTIPEMVPMARAVACEIKLRALLKLRRIAEAEATVTEMEGLGRVSPAYFELRAAVREATGKREAAIALLAEGMAIYPEAGDIRAHLIRLYHVARQNVEEDEAVRGAYDTPPQTPWGFLALFIALLDAGRPRGAREIGRLGLERFPNAEELRVVAAVQRLQVGDLNGARRLVANVQGEWRGVARAVKFSAVFMEQLPQLLRQLVRLVRPGSKPPTLN